MPLGMISETPSETEGLGAGLGRQLRPGDVLLLQGPLGAGKTALTQGIARGMGITAPVTSPTFVLVNEYPGPVPLYHVDLYRIEAAVEADDLGLDEYFFGEGVTVVEWADRAPDAMPPEHLLVELDHAGQQQRRVLLTARGARYEQVIAGLVAFQTGAGRR